MNKSIIELATFDDSFTGSGRATFLRDWLHKFDSGLAANVRHSPGQTVVWIAAGIAGRERVERAKAVGRFAMDYL